MKTICKRILSVSLAAVMALIVLSGCSGNNSSSLRAASSTPESSAQSRVSKKDELVAAVNSDVSTLKPMVQSGQAIRLIKTCLYRGLMAYQADGKIGTEIADSYEIGDDNKTYTFKIRRNAKFHDGSDIAAEDVKFSLERILDESAGATFRSDFTNVLDKVGAVDTETVKITLKESCTPFIDYLILPESVIVSKARCESHRNDLNVNPMGNGPYTFTSWDKGREIVLTAFPDFYKPGKPETKSIRFIITPDATTRASALQTGDADLIDYVAAKDITAIEKDDNYKVYVSEVPSMCLQFNVKSDPLANPKVRQAVAYAVNRQGVIDTAFMGCGTQIFNFPTQKGENGYDGKYDSYFSFDQERVKALLKKAGYPDGFKIKVLSSSTYDMHKQTVIVVQDNLKKIGIGAEMELPDWSTRIEHSNKGDYEILVSDTAGNIVDMDWTTNYFESDEPRMNSSAWFSGAEIDSLLKEGRTTIDVAKREEIYDKLRKRVLDLSSLVFVSYREQAFASSNRVEGFVNLPGVVTYNSDLALEDTYVTE